MSVEQPCSGEELAGLLKNASESGRTISLFGNNSKKLGGGPMLTADLEVSTGSLQRILQHEKNDLTISVEAGMRFEALQAYLQTHGQMIALDPPFAAEATLGGVICADSAGPLSRRFGTARDQVIGMKFATLDGRLIQGGGMVVKNVAGLDIAKLIIGSFGTLAAVVSVNLRVHPLPQQLRTFLISFRTVELAIEKRNQVLQSQLTPWAMDLFSPPASARLGRRGVLLAVRAAGSRRVLDRFESELGAEEALRDHEDAVFWQLASNFSSDFLARTPTGIVIKVMTKLSEVGKVLQAGAGSSISHAASGATYAYFTSWQAVVPLWTAAQRNGWSAVVAFAPDAIRQEKELWLPHASAGLSAGFAMMEKIKQMFDPRRLLNRSRLYGRL